MSKRSELFKKLKEVLFQLGEECSNMKPYFAYTNKELQSLVNRKNDELEDEDYWGERSYQGSF